MSRSVRKTPIFGNAGGKSEKLDKRQAHHTERATARASLASTPDLETLMLSARREAHSNVYNFAKDGKRYSAIRTTAIGRAITVLSAPKWLKTTRDVHQAMGK